MNTINIYKNHVDEKKKNDNIFAIYMDIFSCSGGHAKKLEKPMGQVFNLTEVEEVRR